MSKLLQKRKDNHRAVLEGRFIRKVLTEHSDEIMQEQKKQMNASNFKTPKFFSQRSFNADESSTKLNFIKLHRFVDMKTRKTKSGEVKPRKAHPIYNRIIYGHISGIIRELQFGFSDSVIEELKKLED